ncbi:MAG TPA: Slp family lipoprotein [Rhodanobacteraceae bacterium]|nr:Slp family lipoprotein [Rhodanobacteraceae bacterium]
MYRSILLALLAGGLISCATVPAPLQGQFSESSPAQAVQSGQTGQRVRWGGEIIKVEPKADRTCFEILGRPLNISARPIARDTSEGRFIACHDGFYDPEIFQRGREATVVGRVTGTDRGPVGDYDYTYPHVAADAIHLWPERPVYPRSYDSPFLYDPFWGGFGPYWGPYWGSPPVIIVPGHGPHRDAPPPGNH